MQKEMLVIEESRVEHQDQRNFRKGRRRHLSGFLPSYLSPGSSKVSLNDDKKQKWTVRRCKHAMGVGNKEGKRKGLVDCLQAYRLEFTMSDSANVLE